VENENQANLSDFAPAPKSKSRERRINQRKNEVLKDIKSLIQDYKRDNLNTNGNNPSKKQFSASFKQKNEKE